MDAGDRQYRQHGHGEVHRPYYPPRRQSFSPIISRNLDVLLDVSSKLVGLMGSAKEEEEEEEEEDDNWGEFWVVIFVGRVEMMLYIEG